MVDKTNACATGDQRPDEVISDIYLGGSGCSKTTTLKMSNRLIEPTRGRVEVAGRDVRQQDPVELRRSIGYAFQGIGLFPHMTVAENIAVVPRLLDCPAGQIADRIDGRCRCVLWRSG
jgi:osmoprotectant transport system ATP-binding protein